jgi:hypothetical protein
MPLRLLLVGYNGVYDFTCYEIGWQTMENQVWRLIMRYGNWVLSFDTRIRTRVRSEFVWSVGVIMG